MLSQDPQKSKWRRRLLGALTLLLLVCLASHPELRLLVPFLDALGLDVFVALLSSQALMLFAETLKPFLLLAWQRAMRASHLVIGFCSAALAEHGGPLGQYAWAHLSRSARVSIK